MTDSKDITLSSQPFEPGSTMKRRKVAHPAKSSSQQPPSFEEELLSLEADMDVDIKSKIRLLYFSHNKIAH